MAAAISTVIGVIVGIVLAAGLLRSWERRRASGRLGYWREEEAERIAEASRRQSRAVLLGQIAEQVAPLAAGFPWDPADVRYLGRPVDYLVFDGLADVRAGRSDRLREIVVVDVKTGKAGLSKVERRIRDAVTAGRVTTRLVRPTIAGEVGP